MSVRKPRVSMGGCAQLHTEKVAQEDDGELQDDVDDGPAVGLGDELYGADLAATVASDPTADMAGLEAFVRAFEETL